MPKNKQPAAYTDPASGVSEVIGAVLLISLVVIAITIVGMLLFSQYTPQKVPNINFMTGSDGNNNLLLFHNGGDSLKMGEFFVSVDQVIQPSVTLVGGGTEWSLGKTLQIPGVSAGSHTVQIIYNGTSTSSGVGSTGEVLLRTASANVSAPTYVNKSSDEVPYLDCSAVRNWACAVQIPDAIIQAQYKNRTEAQRVSFMKQQTGGGLLGASTAPWTPTLTVTVNDTTGWSKIVRSKTGNNCGAADIIYNFNRGDILTLSQKRDVPAFFILYGMAPQIWEMAGNGWITINSSGGSNIYSSPTAGDLICHTYINEYVNLSSSLIVQGSDSQSTETSLVINKSIIIDGQNAQTITLYNFTPTKTDVYLLESVKSGQSAVYFIGWPEGGIYNDTGWMIGFGL